MTATPTLRTTEDDAAIDISPPSEPAPTTDPGRLRRWASDRRLWFPAAALVGFLLLIGLGWNGSSSGAVRTQLEGSTPDPSHVFGEPNPIRSDEWWVTTPYLISQDSLDYPRVNSDAFGGTDVSVISAIPYREWSAAFRPQFWAFFVLPFDQAFAYYWWLPALILALGTYALVLALCPNRPGMAAAAAAMMCFAPFVQWWYLVITMGSLGWGAALAAGLVMLQRVRSRVAIGAVAAGVAYASAAFVFVLYPAFQVPTLWVVGAIALGWTFRAGAVQGLRERLGRLALGGAAAGAGAAAFGVFALTRSDLFELQANTEYPGRRVVASGGGTTASMFSGFLDARLTPSLALPGVGGNPSEASAFVLIGVFLAVPALWLLWRGRRERAGIDGLLVALLGVLGLFLAFSYVTGIDFVAKLTLLSMVPPTRLYLGYGLLSLALLVAVVRELDRQGVRPPLWVAGLSGAVALAVHLRAGQLVEKLAPDFAGPRLSWVLLAIGVAVLVAFAARGHATAALCALVAFSVVATYDVNPIRDGVYDTRETAIGKAVVATDREDPGTWVAVGSVSTIVLLNEQPVLRLSGTALHPDFDDWTELGSNGENRVVFNRYAHIIYVADRAAPPLAVPTPDQVHIRFEGCGRFAQNEVDHVLSDKPIRDRCLDLRESVEMPTKNEYYIYDVVEEDPTSATGDPSAIRERAQ